MAKHTKTAPRPVKAVLLGEPVLTVNLAITDDDGAKRLASVDLKGDDITAMLGVLKDGGTSMLNGPLSYAGVTEEGQQAVARIFRSMSDEKRPLVIHVSVPGAAGRKAVESCSPKATGSMKDAPISGADGKADQGDGKTGGDDSTGAQDVIAKAEG